MELLQIKEKYKKAHRVFLKHKDSNKTNGIESKYIPEVLQFLQEYKPKSRFIVNNDNLINYLGVNIIEITFDGKIKTWGFKVCRHCKDFEVLCDGWKHSGKEYYKSTDVKLNDYFVFMNEKYFIVLPFKVIADNIPPQEECFYLTRDLYQTTSKFVFDTKYYRKYYKER